MSAKQTEEIFTTIIIIKTSPQRLPASGVAQQEAAASAGGYPDARSHS